MRQSEEGEDMSKVTIEGSGTDLLIKASDGAAVAESAVSALREAIWQSVNSVSREGRPFTLIRRHRSAKKRLAKSLINLQPTVE